MNYDFYIDKIWYNYLDLEATFINTLQYISLDTDNYEVFSNTLTNQILANCTELESILKRATKTTDRHTNITKLLEKLIKDEKWKEVFNEEVLILRNEKINVTPFENINVETEKIIGIDDKTKGGEARKIGILFWWTAYNNLKHWKFDNFKDGNLKNALYSLAGLFIIVTYFHYINFADTAGKLNYPEERSRLFK